MKQYKVAGRKVWLNTEDGGISKRLIKTKGCREPGYQWILKREASGVAFDVGANLGWYTLLMAERCKVVYAFEPDPRSFKLLKKNAPFRDNVQVTSLAVDQWSHRTYMELDKRPNLSRIGDGDGSHEVDTVTIDDFCQSVCRVPDFVKMDIEGGETAAFRGARETTAEHEVKLLVEVHPQYYGPENDFATELEHLVSLGYRFKYLVNAKGKASVFKDAGYKPRKTFKDYKARSVYEDIKPEHAIPWCTELPKDGLKVVRSFLLTR